MTDQTPADHSGRQRAARRLWYETRDWCRSVQGTPSPRTHAALMTAQHSPEVWRAE